MPDPVDFRAEWPDELKTDPSLAQFKSTADLAKSFRETKALVGSSIRMPGPDASPEVRKEFVEKLQKASPDILYAPESADESVLKLLWRRLGKPEKPEEYTLPEDAKAVGVDETEMRAIAQVAGLTKAQFATLTAETAKVKAAAAAALKEGHAKLDAEWGAAAGERRKAAAVAGLKLGMSSEAAKAIEEGRAPADQVKFMYTVAQAIGADPKEIDRQKDGGAPPTLTPAEAKLQLAEIRARPEYWERHKNPTLHDSLKVKVVELTKLAHPQ